MGERRYQIGKTSLVFNPLDDDWRCLCAFPHDDEPLGLDANGVCSLALFGAAVVLVLDGAIAGEYAFLPDCVPQWIRDAIRRCVTSEANAGGIP